LAPELNDGCKKIVSRGIFQQETTEETKFANRNKENNGKKQQYI